MYEIKFRVNIGLDNGLFGTKALSDPIMVDFQFNIDF